MQNVPQLQLPKRIQEDMMFLQRLDTYLKIDKSLIQRISGGLLKILNLNPKKITKIIQNM